jgi:D-glycero-alpha-D-manno-heptose-7-phosphate kinase
MIITRTPLRVSFLGGGSDFPEFYEENGGAVLSCAIAQHIYITCHPLVESNHIMLKYSKLELAENPREIQHPVLREIIKKYDLFGIDISVSSDIPAGTGLGSSSAFTVGALHTIRSYQGISSTNFDLAVEACEIEIDFLREPIGIQDQFATSLGGFNFLEFKSNRKVQVKTIELTEELEDFFTQNFLLVRVPGNRLANTILKEQRNTLLTKRGIAATQELMDLAIDLGSDFKPDLRKLASALNESWTIKKTLSGNISNPDIDELYEYFLSNGVLGAKLLGAGASGYMLIAASSDTIDGVESNSKFKTLRLNIDRVGSQVVYDSVKF